MNIKLLFIYKGPKTTTLRMESEWFQEEYAEKMIDDLIKTGRVTDLTIVDELGREWNRKEFEKLRRKMEEEPTNPILYFDGGFHIGSGAAGTGMVIYYNKGKEQYRLRSNAKLNELETNNEAEYAALYNGLTMLEEIGVRHLPCVIKGDSQGVLKQLAGEWPCYESNLNRWLDRIEEKISSLGLKPTFEVISRNDNKEADKLAGQALAENFISSHVKLNGNEA